MAIAGEEAGSGVWVFLAEDDQALRATLGLALRRDGHVVVEASNGEAMLFELVRAGAERRGRAVVVCDVRMPGCDGFTLLRDLRAHGVDCPPFLFTTAFPDAGVVREAYELGAVGVLAKPFEIGELRRLVRARASARVMPWGC